MSRVPTVNDLRVKLCYICREEEQHGAPADPPRRWVHPCKCTLVAHEDCLLEWIRAGMGNPDKPTSSVLKCPQCGFKYGLDSKNPLILKIMDNANEIVSILGHGATIVAVGSLAASLGAGVYILLTSYGAFAMQRFVGREMFNLILSDDPSSWPFHAWINLPLIPLSLIAGHTKKFRDTLPLLPMMIFWPSVPPISSVPSSPGLLANLRIGQVVRTSAEVQSPAEIELDTLKALLFSWPPSPAAFCLGVPFIRAYYRYYMRKLRQYVLGEETQAKEDTRGNLLRDVVVQNWRMEMHIEDDVVEVQGAEVAGGGRAAEPAHARADDAPGIVADDNNVELVLEGQGGARQQQDDAPAPAPARNVQAPAGAARPRNANNAAGQGGEGQQPAERQRDPVRLHVSGGKLGRVLGNALLTPAISSIMGKLLLRLALPSGSNAHQFANFNRPLGVRGLLNRFLAIKPPGSAPLISATQMYKIPVDAGFWLTMRYSFAITTRLIFVGTPAWCGADPVWWRNAVGLGIWTLAKDLISISYEYLSKQEEQSRKLKDRPFTEVDPKELDLLPECPVV